MILIFDTETSSLVNPSLDFNHPLQGRLMQLGFILLDDSLNEVVSYCSLLKIPEWTEIHSKAFEKHKIPKERCHKYGVTYEYAFNIFEECLKASKHVVAFNIDFDKAVLDYEHKILNGYTFDWSQVELHCAMRISTNVVQLPFAGNRRLYGQKYKWPKLEEAYAFCMHKVFEGAHNALSDCQATASILKYLIEHNHVKI